jgi:hypothetical protein
MTWELLFAMVAIGVAGGALWAYVKTRRGES